MLRLRQALKSGNYDMTYSEEYIKENKEIIDRYHIERGEVTYDLPQKILIDIKMNNILGKKETRNYMEVYERHIKCEPNPVEKEFFAFFFRNNGDMLVISFILLVIAGVTLFARFLKRMISKSNK